MEKEVIRRNIERAAELLEQGEEDRAGTILRETLEATGFEKSACREVLILLIRQEMYGEALRLLEDYRRVKGEDLPSDFHPEDIRRWLDEREKKASQYEQHAVKVFKKRKSARTNLFCFTREVRISDETIEFVSKKRTDLYLWARLSDVYLTKKEAPRNPYSDTIDHIVFVADGRKYRFRTDPVFEDLEDTKLFLKEVRKHRKLPVRKKKTNPWFVIAAIVLIISVLILLTR